MKSKNVCIKCGKYRKYLINEVCHPCNYSCKPNEIKCKICGKIKHRRAKGMCHNCYIHKGTPKVICKCCGKQKNHWAKGYCSNCFNKLFYYDKIRASNVRKDHNISLELYKNVTKSCILCGFDKIVDLHHLDKDHNNNLQDNLIGLCPNHHKMIHTEKFSQETEEKIRHKLDKTPL